MIIEVLRDIKTKHSTTSIVSIDGKQVCYALEDVSRKPGESHPQGATAIPLGEYQVVFRKAGGMYNRYCARFPEIRQERGMLHIYNIPGLKYDKWYAFPGVSPGACVLIHCGNTDADTLGCLLLGAKRGADMVRGSWEAYKDLYVLVADALEKGEKVTIEFKEC